MNIMCGHCHFKVNVDKQEGKIIRLSCATCKISVEGKDEIEKALKEMFREWRKADLDAAINKSSIRIEIDGVEVEGEMDEGETRMKNITSRCNFYFEVT